MRRAGRFAALVLPWAASWVVLPALAEQGATYRNPILFAD